MEKRNLAPILCTNITIEIIKIMIEIFAFLKNLTLKWRKVT